MMTKKEFLKQWDKAKSFANSGQLKLSIETYEALVPLINDIKAVFPREDYASDEHYIEQMHFEQAMFWGDFTASLCDEGQFDSAIEASKKALYHKEAANLSTLLYIFFNTGNIYLLSQNYEEAIKWYDKALYENECNEIWLNEKERADYYSNKAEALYFLGRYEEAEELFLKAIQTVQNYKNFEPFYFLKNIYELKNDTKQSEKFYKMFTTRKRKLSDEDFLQRTRFYPIKID